jgi:YD repeat-containing protein
MCSHFSPRTLAWSFLLALGLAVVVPAVLWGDICPTGPSGTDEFPMLVNFAVSVTPDGARINQPHDVTGRTATFLVINTGTCPDTFNFTSSVTGPISGVTLSKQSWPLAPGAGTTVTATYNVGASGTGVLTVTATGASTNNGSYTVTVVPAGAPVVDATPYNYGKQDYALCAVGCFATVYTQSTVPYFSFDTPRDVTLVYNSDRVNPRPFVHVNVTPDISYGQTPTEYRLQVKVSGVTKTLVNGDTLLRFTYPGSPKVRLGGQFDAASYATGVYDMDILVTALYQAGPITNDVVTKLVVVNETNAAVAGGWTLGGIQKLYSYVDGALVTEGDGGSVYFANVLGAFVSPAGEFSKLIPSTLSGTNGWARVYPDSSKAVFDNTGKLVQLRDRFNNMTTIVYDGSGRVSQVRDPANLAITLG